MDGENTHKEDTVESESAVRKTEDVSAPGVSLRAPAVAKNWLTELVSGAVEAYAKELKDSPIRTKALTSCVISMLGELIGTALKPRKPDGSRGPFFHWWYGVLEKNVSAMKLPSSYLVTLVKVAITQIVMTPPFLVFTLAYIKYFLSFDTHETVMAVKKTFAVALLTNYKVWTVAQAVNFQVVPLDYRVLFGNMIALWWNVYLSLTSHSS